MLKLIINSNKDVLDNRILNEFRNNGYKRENIEFQENFLPFKTKGLFPEQNKAIWLNLESTTDIANFKKRLKDDKNIKNDILNQDIIIGLNTFRATQKIEKFIKDLNGEVIKEKNINIELLLGEYPLKRNLIYDVKDFIGEDDEKILSFINTLDNMSDDEIRKIDNESIYVLLDPRPGSIPIYQFVNPLMNGDIRKTIDYFDRITEHIHPLACLKTLKNRVELLYRANSLYNEGYQTPKRIAEVLDVKSYPIQLLWHLIDKDYDVERICSIVLELEKGLKGSSVVDGKDLFKRYLIEIALITGRYK